MTRPDLDALSALADAATPGPWENYGYEDRPNWIIGHSPDGPEGGYYGKVDVLCIQDENLDGSYMNDADAEFIAASRTAVPALIAYARELEQRIDELGRITGDASLSPAQKSAQCRALYLLALSAGERRTEQ